MKTRKVENKYASFHIEDGILYFVYKENKNLTREGVMQVVKDRLSLQEGKAYPVICDIRNLKEVDKEGRDYLAKEGSTLVKAVALIVGSPAMKVMTNFYLAVSKPIIPTRMFTSQDEALKFLEPFKEKD